jgi:hypothetical protein
VTMGVTVSGAPCAAQTLIGSTTASAELGRSSESGSLCPTSNFDRAIVARALLAKRLQALDPHSLDEARMISRTAKLLNNEGFIIEASRQLVRDEIRAFVEAAEEVDLIRIPVESRAQVFDAMEKLALKATALD